MESNRKNLILKYPGTDEYAIEYQTIGEFLESDFIKQIPPYQRLYSWGNRTKRLGMIFLSRKKEKVVSGPSIPPTDMRKIREH